MRESDGKRQHRDDAEQPVGPSDQWTTIANASVDY
jgi:hypothetical protein